MLYKDFIKKLDQEGIEVMSPIGSDVVGAQMVMTLSALTGAVTGCHIWCGNAKVEFDLMNDGPGNEVLRNAYNDCLYKAKALMRVEK